MRNLLLEYTIINLPQETQENSCFKPINEAGAKLFHFVEANLSDEMKMTAAYHAFERSWVEFINNSHDAGATRVKVQIFQNDNEIAIQLKDNGRGLPKEKETTQYDWKKALQTISSKADEAKATGIKSCGQHLALSTTAYVLERQGGRLGISNNTGASGAQVTLISSLTPCDSHDFLEPQPGKGKNILDEMFHIIIEQDKSGLATIERLAGSPDIRGSRQDSAKRVFSRLTTPIEEMAASPHLSTPVLSLSSPAFLRRLGKNASFTGSTPLNTPASTPSNASLPASFFSPCNPNAAKNNAFSSSQSLGATPN
jgi:hypothetical protein